MKSLMRMLRSVARAMSRLVMITVRIGDRLISKLVPAPMPTVDELEPDAADNAERDTGSAFMPIRNLAYARLSGTMPKPTDLAAAGKLSSEWVSSMTPEMLKKVLLADDVKLHKHLRGVETLKGVLRYDEAAIDEYRIALLRQRAAEEAAKRRAVSVSYA